jgi:GntR family transcriptional regulator
VSADLPAYRRIADDLRRQITSGELPPGSALPSQAVLEQRYGVARMTVRNALDELANEGLITSQQGKAATVRDRRHMVHRPQADHEPRTSATLDRFMALFEEADRRPSQAIDVTVVAAPSLIAERLRIEPGTRVVVRRRVRSLDGEPFNINDTYYPFDLAIDTPIMDPADIPAGSNNVFIERTGRAEARNIDEIYVRMPTPDESARLRLSPGTPLACHYLTAYTDDGQPLFVDVFVLPGDRHVIVYDRPVETPPASGTSSE